MRWLRGLSRQDLPLISPPFGDSQGRLEMIRLDDPCGRGNSVSGPPAGRVFLCLDRVPVPVGSLDRGNTERAPSQVPRLKSRRPGPRYAGLPLPQSFQFHCHSLDDTRHDTRSSYDAVTHLFRFSFHHYSSTGVCGGPPDNQTPPICILTGDPTAKPETRTS